MSDDVRHADKVFRRFSPFIRDYIYRSGWNALRLVQVKAAEILFFTDQNLLICSQTASGKTEAAFFPILSMMQEAGPENFMALYIAPLKSLINDQYGRMEELLRESKMPVCRWHGDVAQSQKTAFLKNPRGLLQITPESLESMLCRRSQDIPRIFANLEFVIIDEIHALTGSDRGSQILCQIQRLSRLIGKDLRRVALSATVGEPEKVASWLNGSSWRTASHVHIPEEGLSWKLALNQFFSQESAPDKIGSAADRFVYDATAGHKCVVFANSREETEEICASLRDIAKKRHEPDRFYIHHGNLSAAIREDTEAVLKNVEKGVTACASVTLELGIDIGSLRRIINLGSPTGVSSFLQRLGRSGRRGNDPEMLMVFREEEPLENAPIYELIPWELLQAIAIIELYRTERFIEPPREKPLPLSLLFHQTLSVLSAKASLFPHTLAKEVLTLDVFKDVAPDDYRTFLKHLLRDKILDKLETGELIVGEKGEKILSSFRFFAVFRDSEDFTVRSGSEEIGTITTAPPPGEHFALAGRVWEVEENDLGRRLVYVHPVEGKMKIAWPGGIGEIHTRILEKMREILLSDDEYPYLMPKCAARLKTVRELAKRTRFAEKPITALSDHRFVIFPWLGTRGFNAYKRLLQHRIATNTGLKDVQSGGCYYITFRSENATEKDVIEALKNWNETKRHEPTLLIGKSEYPAIDKFDAYLPQDLLIKAYGENHLNVRELEYRISTY